MMPPRLETVTEEFCGWPYFQPYVFTQRKKNKPRKPKTRSPIAKDLGTKKYRARVIPNKKRKAKAPAITLEV